MKTMTTMTYDLGKKPQWTDGAKSITLGSSLERWENDMVVLGGRIRGLLAVRRHFPPYLWMPLMS